MQINYDKRLKKILLVLLLFRLIAFAQAVPNAEIFLLGELQLVVKGQRMLSPYMSKTFLSILAVPNKTDFCTIPTSSLIASVSIHSLKPLLMHPRAPATTDKPQPFSMTKVFSALSSNSDIFNIFDFFLTYPTITWYSYINDDA